MRLISRFVNVFFALFSLQALAQVSAHLEIKDVRIHQQNGHWVSEWVEFEVPPNTASFQINAFGSPETFVQVTDLVDPDGIFYVKSDGNAKLSVYSQPILRNIISPNQTHAVIRGMSSTLVPNNPELGSPPAGIWKFRTLSHYQPLLKVLSFEIVLKPKSALVKNKIDIRVLVSPQSYWTQRAGHIEQVLQVAKESLTEAGLELRTLSIQMLKEKTPEPMALPIAMTAIAAENNFSDAINVYLMPSMEYQNKPVNGLACIGGPMYLKKKHACFVSMYADTRADQIGVEQQGRILAHEIGHYLGLFHTRDDGYHGIGTVYDKLTDTSEVITGANMMDPGIHDETPHFSDQQKSMLRLSPALR